MVFVAVNVTKGAEKLPCQLPNETYLISDPLNVVDIHPSKVVIAENVVKVVMKLLKHETAMSIVHKRVS